MRRGTTPTHIFKLPEEVLVDSLNTIYITYSQGGKVILDKTNTDIITDTENNSMSVTLTQEDTLKLFSKMPVEIQIRATVGDAAIASLIIETSVNRILKGGVI